MTKLLDRPFVWLGGALFVASLATTGWTYALWWADVHPWAGWPTVAVDVALFSAFALHHSVCARTRLKQAIGAVIPERLIRSVYVWIASLLLIGVCVLWQRVGGELYDVTALYRRAVHIVLQLSGVWFIARSVGTIDALELAGIRTARTVAGTTESLQVRGPYRLVRHPLYLGWVLIVFGAAHMTGDRLLFAIVTTAYLLVAIPWEERSLEAVFGGEYVRYKRLVPWRVIPYIY